MDTALILAGGSSARLGRPKALLDFGGKAIVRRVFDAVAPLAAEIVVSVADARMAAAVRPALPPVHFVVDRRRAIGPIEGIQRGFAVAKGERILVAPCDAPLLHTELYRLLLECLGAHDAAVPRLEAFDPVRAVYMRQAALRVLERTNKPIESPSALVDRLDAVFVEAEQLRSIDPGLDSFIDVNTPGDLDEVLRRVRAPGP
jgi:molybdopterin-guanine dinucleotide biosynthesis protein A